MKEPVFSVISGNAKALGFVGYFTFPHLFGMMFKDHTEDKV